MGPNSNSECRQNLRRTRIQIGELLQKQKQRPITFSNSMEGKETYCDFHKF